MALPAKQLNYTFADLLGWDDPQRAELIGGEIFMMAPPSRVHQRISVELTRQLANFLEGKGCEVYAAPFAVRLFAGEESTPENTDTVLEPDISVICDKSKLDRYGCKGAPDFIIEILSPSTRRHDRLVKLGLYQQAGVREYWIVDPESRSVLVFLSDGSGMLRIQEDYSQNDIARVSVLEGCFLELSKVFGPTDQ